MQLELLLLSIILVILFITFATFYRKKEKQVVKSLLNQSHSLTKRYIVHTARIILSLLLLILFGVISLGVFNTISGPVFNENLTGISTWQELIQTLFPLLSTLLVSIVMATLSIFALEKIKLNIVINNQIITGVLYYVAFSLTAITMMLFWQNRSISDLQLQIFISLELLVFVFVPMLFFQKPFLQIHLNWLAKKLSITSIRVLFQYWRAYGVSVPTYYFSSDAKPWKKQLVYLIVFVEGSTLFVLAASVTYIIHLFIFG